MPKDEVKKYRISKYSVRNSFKKPEHLNIDDLHRAKQRLTARLGMSLVHKGGRADSNTNQSSSLKLHNQESMESFDPTRT